MNNVLDFETDRRRRRLSFSQTLTFWFSPTRRAKRRRVEKRRSEMPAGVRNASSFPAGVYQTALKKLFPGKKISMQKMVYTTVEIT